MSIINANYAEYIHNTTLCTCTVYIREQAGIMSGYTPGYAGNGSNIPAGDWCVDIRSPINGYVVIPYTLLNYLRSCTYDTVDDYSTWAWAPTPRRIDAMDYTDVFTLEAHNLLKRIIRKLCNYIQSINALSVSGNIHAMDIMYNEMYVLLQLARYYSDCSYHVPKF